MADLPPRLGPYEIVGPLGAGGMGKVYRGRDTRLHRNVAIKIVDESGAVDAAKHRRFAQEAIAASALNHPNIVTVYDVGVDADVPYLVSELIEGEPLRAEMNAGRVPLKRVIEITHQIAEGLAAAHEAGIVHRDLKPENVMITADGRVKIVDFGLAKAMRDDDPLLGSGSATQTAAGLIVGTVPYMSPEQARGTKADFRSDQFALGVILFELVTRSHPFKRDTAVQTLSAIIGEEPPDIAQLSPALPVAIRWLIRRLLSKNPRERFANTGDLAADLRIIREHFAEATAAVAVPGGTAKRATWQMRLAAIAAIAAIAFLLGRSLGSDAPAETFDKFTPFATDAGYQGAPAWSPDGKKIAYEAEVDGVVQIFTRTLGSPTRQKVTNSAVDCYHPIWSADGYIYYVSQAKEHDALWRVNPVAGRPDVVIDNVQESHISRDGKTVALLRDLSEISVRTTLWFATLPDGVARRYERGAFRGNSSGGAQLRFAPTGSKLLIWFGLNENATADAHFWKIDSPDSDPRVVLRAIPSSPGLTPPLFTWLPDSRHVVVTRSDGPTPGTHLWLADTQTDRVVPLTITPGQESSPAASPQNGTIAFTSEATDFDLIEVSLDGSPLKPFLSTTRNEFDPAVSPRSTQYAFVTDAAGKQQIWLRNQEGYLNEPLVTETDFGGVASMAVGSLAFSNDGEKVAFQRAMGAGETNAIAGSRIWIKSISGGVPPEQLGGGEDYQDAPTWSPDGEWIAYLSAGQIGLALVKARVGLRQPPMQLKTNIPQFIARPRWSHDGKSILCETSDGLSIVAADGTGSRVISDSGWFAYDWAEDDRRIYGLRPTETQRAFMLVSVDTQSGAEHVINANTPTWARSLKRFSQSEASAVFTAKDVDS